MPRVFPTFTTVSLFRTEYTSISTFTPLLTDSKRSNLEVDYLIWNRSYTIVDSYFPERKVGTTGKGIGPSYSSKAARSGIRLSEVFDEELFESKLRRLAAGYAKRYGDLLKYDVEEEIARFKEYRPKLAKHAVDAVAFMSSAQESNTSILIEGANVCTPCSLCRVSTD
jgi:adenylosuccinate synthase